MKKARRNICQVGSARVGPTTVGREIGDLWWAAADGHRGQIQTLPHTLNYSVNSKAEELLQDQKLTDLKIDGAEPLVCGELQDWPFSKAFRRRICNVCTWRMSGWRKPNGEPSDRPSTRRCFMQALDRFLAPFLKLYLSKASTVEADYLNHREFVIFNGK